MAKAHRWTLAETIRVARSLAETAGRYEARLVDRDITREFREALGHAVEVAEVAAAHQPVRLGAQKGTTKALQTIIDRVEEATGAIRRGVLRIHPKRDDLHDKIGVGMVDGGLTLRDAIALADAILDNSEAHQADLRAAKTLPRDIEALRIDRLGLLAANETQEEAKGAKVTGTSAKDALLADLIRRCDEVLAAADNEFPHEPKLRAEFFDVLPTKAAKDDDDKGGQGEGEKKGK